VSRRVSLRTYEDPVFYDQAQRVQAPPRGERANPTDVMVIFRRAVVTVMPRSGSW
jgi:hypothetical protein